MGSERVIGTGVTESAEDPFVECRGSGVDASVGPSLKERLISAETIGCWFTFTEANAVIADCCLKEAEEDEDDVRDLLGPLSTVAL